MTVPHSPPALVMVLHQPQGYQPVQDTAEAECIQRTSGPADMLEGCKALAFVPYKGTAAFAHMQVVVSTGRRLVLGWVVQQQEVHRWFCTLCFPAAEWNISFCSFLVVAMGSCCCSLYLCRVERGNQKLNLVKVGRQRDRLQNQCVRIAIRNYRSRVLATLLTYPLSSFPYLP